MKISQRWEKRHSVSPHEEAAENRPSSPRTRNRVLSTMPAPPHPRCALLFGSQKTGWGLLILPFMHSFIHCTGVCF